MGIDIFQILKIVIALCLVVFVHELGHFLVARWCGVLVERFSIGFGPVIFSFKWGETEYAISAIPLGGYVKMLGQSDTNETLEPTTDERSYQNKSVGKRMAIISAGVLMNVLFGFVCFSVAYHAGVPTQSAIIGATLPDNPAWRAGLRSGDELVAINGHRPAYYELLLTEVALTRPPHGVVNLKVDREGKEFDVQVQPIQDDKKPKIGVLPGSGLNLFEREPYSNGTPASNPIKGKFQGGDEVVAVQGKPVRDHVEFTNAMFDLQDKPVTLTVRRKEAKQSSEDSVEIAPNYVKTLGLQMQIAEVVALQAGAPAAKGKDEDGNPAEILPKDIIAAVDGVEEIDPMRLPDVITASAGKPVELTILRPGPSQLKSLKIKIVPEKIPTWIDFPDFPVLEKKNGWPYLTVPSLGIAYKVLPTVRKVLPDSPAAKAKEPIKPGDVVKRVEVTFEDKSLSGASGKTTVKALDVGDTEWPIVFWAMQFPYFQKIKLTMGRGNTTYEAELEATPDTTWPLRYRGLNFGPAQTVRQASGIVDAVQMGFDKTRTSVVNLYLILRGLILGIISPQNLVGPIQIAQEAYFRAERSFGLLLEFLALLNINLAVINFLPIPVLDGGHMFFLTYELIMKRQPSEKLVAVANYFGLFLILSLMVFVIGLDICRLNGLL